MRRASLLIAGCILCVLSLAYAWDFPGMRLGGDDSGLYYRFPDQWADRVATHAWYSTFLGNSPQFFFLPFTEIVALVAKTPLDPQATLLAVNVVAGFVFTFLVIRRVTGAEGSCAAAGLGAVIYVSSPLVLFTQWANLLYSIYWIAVLPGLLYFLLEAATRERIYWVLGSLPLAVGFAPALAAVPWTAASAVGVVMFLLLVMPTSARPSVLFRYAGAQLALVVGISAFWLVPSIATLREGNPQVAVALGDGGTQRVVETVRAQGATTNLVDTLAGHVSQGMMERFSWPQLELASLSYRLVPVNLLLLAAAVSGFFIAGDERRRRRIAGAGLTAFVLLLLVSNTLGLVELVVAHVPGTVMFRTFYDKFAIPAAFFSALFVALGLSELAARLRLTRKQTLVAASAFTLVLGAQAFPLLTGSIFKQPIVSGSSIERSVVMPEDLQQLGARLTTAGGGGILHAPLLTPEWTGFVSARSQGVYLGISPMKLLAQRSPFVGEASFVNDIDPTLPETVKAVLSSRDSTQIRDLLAWLGIDIVVVERTPPDEVLARLRWDPLRPRDWERLLEQIGASIVIETPERAAYQLPRRFVLPTIYAVGSVARVLRAGGSGHIVARLSELADTAIIAEETKPTLDGPTLHRPELTFARLSPVEYRIHVRQAAGPFILIFNQGFAPSWRLSLVQGGFACEEYVQYSATATKECISDQKPSEYDGSTRALEGHLLVNGYQNGWLVEPVQSEFDLILYFEPQRYFYSGIRLSGVTVLIIIGGFTLWALVRLRARFVP